MEATTAAKITAVREEDLDGGPAGETVRFGIGGTDDETDVSARGRIPAGVIQPYRAAVGGRRLRPGASLTGTNPGGQSTMRSSEGPRPHMVDMEVIVRRHDR
jgi:hypothetical protein